MIDVGSLSEIKVAAVFAERGYDVFVPWGGKTKADLLVELDGEIKRVQVKGCANESKAGNWEVHLKSVRPNKTQNKIINFNSDDCDVLAVYIVPEDRVVLIDATTITAKSMMTIKSIANMER